MANIARALRADFKDRLKDTTVQDYIKFPPEELKVCVYDGDRDVTRSIFGMNTGVYYGYRKSGDIFLMHIDDISAQPHLFKPIGQKSSSYHSAWFAFMVDETARMMNNVGITMEKATTQFVKLALKFSRSCSWCDTQDVIFLTPVSPGGYYTCPICGGYA